MAWDFETDPEFQEKLDWIEHFTSEYVEPLGDLFPGPADPFDFRDPVKRRVTEPLKDEVKRRQLWACHLGPDLGGPGYGQVKLALMNEILGRTSWGPTIFGCQAPDSGNAEILAHYGTEEQKKKYLEPLLAHEMSSCFSMTEPQAGSDPREFVCRARLDGDEWVIEGEKWFSSHARLAGFLIVMAITDPKVSVHQGASMFLVPTDTPGIRFLHHAGIGNEPMNDGYHAHILYDGVRVSKDNLLGEPGTAFQIAQTRLSGGRIHHAMRTIGKTKWALRIMCERALSRRAQGERLADKQMVQDYIGRSFTEIEQFRLLVLYTAWLIDKGDRTQARVYVAAVKAQASEVIHDVMRRCLQVHGSLGISNLMPLQFEWLMAAAQGVMDGPSEVHRFGVAKHVLKQYEPYEGIWPKDFLPQRLEAAKKKFAELLEHDIVNF